MATLSDLIPDICPELPQCSITLVQRQLLNTLRDFCWQTHYWQQAMTPITLLPFNESAPDTYIYTLPVPEGTELITTAELVFNGNPLNIQSASWLDEHVHRWREKTGNPDYVLIMSNKQVRFVPASETVQPVAITGQLILQPAREATSFSDDLLDFDYPIANGALSRLLIMPNKPWSNTRRAATCEGIYQEGVSRAKFLVLKNFSTGAETIEQRTWLYD